MLDVDGLDAEAWEIIGRRRHDLRIFLEHMAGDQLRGLLTVVEDDSVLRQPFLALERSVPAEAYLPLAQQLGFVDAIRRRNYLRFWRSQMLSNSIWPTYTHASKNGIATTLEDIEHKLLAVVEASEHVTDWVSALSQQRLCRDDVAARRIAYELDRIDGLASSQARDLILTWCRVGPFGLLKHSDYPCFGDLMILQRHEPSIVEIRSDASTIMAILRSDVIALYRAFHQADFLKVYQTSNGSNTHPWDQSLLHQPPNVEVRKRAQTRITPLKHILIPILVTLRGCDETTAESLLNALLQSGLSGLIDLRCDEGNETAGYRREREQISKVAGQLLKSIPLAKREQILARLENLHDAAITSGVSFPLLNLIRHLPSSKYRKRCQRRKIPDTLIKIFAEREGIATKTAWSYVKNLLIYGPLGMLPKREWSQAIHPRLWSYLHMLKLGRLEDTISETIVTEHVNIYARMLGVEPLPKQIVIDVFSHFSRPSYYNSGDGEAIAGVPLRKALKLAGVARLHEQWMLFPIELGIDLVSPALRSLGGVCSVVLVLDCGSQRPVGFWVSEKPATSVEVGLALYDAIFHRTALHWPLRGIPENILLPKTLLNSANNLYRAAAFLMAEVATINSQEEHLHKLPYAKEMIAELRKEYEPARLSGRRRAPRRQITIQQAEDEIRGWLYKRCFPNHRTDPVPASLRKQGVALPGYDTPAAGWLLPIVAENVRTVRGGVEVDRHSYRDPAASIEPGLTVRVRATPPRLGQRRAVFIELTDFPSASVHYLPRSSARQKD